MNYPLYFCLSKKVLRSQVTRFVVTIGLLAACSFNSTQNPGRGIEAWRDRRRWLSNHINIYLKEYRMKIAIHCNYNYSLIVQAILSTIMDDGFIKSNGF